MKKLSILMAMCMATAMCSAGPPASKLEIGGKFISEKNVQYDVFIINADSTLDAQSVDKGFKYFNVQMHLNEHYLIKFTSKDGVKYLYVEPTVPGNFTVDVDFTMKGSAKVYYHYGNKSYEVQPLPTAGLDYAQK